MDCTFTLTIPSVDLKDTDTYSVKLPDESQSSARLKVLATPVKVLTPLKLEPNEPVLGDQFTLSITLSRDVKNNFKWVKAGKDLSLRRDPRISFKQEEDPDNHGQRYSVTVRDSKPDDEGTYRFEVESSNISDSKIVQLVEPKIIIVQCDEIVQGKLGSPVTLSCQVNLPQGQVIWYHDGIKLASSDSVPSRTSGITLKNTDVTRTLTITNLKKDDLGSYVVKTKDDKREIQVQQQTDDDQLKVLAHPPKLVDLDQDESLVLSLVTNRKCPIEFFKGKQVLKTKESFDADESRYTVTFSIEKASLDDAGMYKALVSGTTFVYDTEVMVHDPYERQKLDSKDMEMPLAFVKKLENQKVKEGEEIVLECQLNRAPRSNVTWFRNDKELSANENLVLTQDGDRLTLKILRSSVEDQGEYMINVENLRGFTFVEVVCSFQQYIE